MEILKNKTEQNNSNRHFTIMSCIAIVQYVDIYNSDGFAVYSNASAKLFQFHFTTTHFQIVL